MIIFGKHACESALANPKRKIKRIYVTDRTKNDIRLAHNHPTPKIINIREFDKLVPHDSVHQGIAIEAEPLTDHGLKSIYNENLLVILDQVTDPHNVGAIMRSCAAFGAGAIIVPKDNAPTESGTMAKAASGAMEIIPICKVTNLARAMEELKKEGFWIAGLDGRAKGDLKSANLKGKTAIVLGAEGRGLRPLTQKNCDILVKLPISEKMESLNVSNAAAICLYELASGL